MQRLLVARICPFLVGLATIILIVAPAHSFADNPGQGAYYDCSQPTTVDGFVPLVCAQQSPMLQSAYSQKSLGSYVDTIFKTMITIGAVLAILRISYAGYLMMSSEMWSSRSHAKEVFGDAVFGLVLLLGIVLVLQQINPNILNLEVLKNVTPAPSGTTTPAPTNP